MMTQFKQTPLSRVDGWPTRLNDVVAQYRALPFQWGKNDCCLFAADTTLAITGTDLAVGSWRGKYSTEEEVQSIMAALNFTSLLDMATYLASTFNLPLIKPMQCRRGDLIMVDTLNPDQRFLHAIGVCLGAQVAVMGPTGLTFLTLGGRQVPLNNPAWRIG